jgi:putative DNA primase/helicase
MIDQLTTPTAGADPLDSHLIAVLAEHGELDDARCPVCGAKGRLRRVQGSFLCGRCCCATVLLLQGSHKPSTVPVDPEGIPLDVRQRQQWGLWGWGWDAESQKWKKPPSSSSTDPTAWLSFEEAYRRYQAGGFDGVAYALSADDPFCVVDLDAALDDAEREEILRSLDSYEEESASGRGQHGWVKATLPGAGKHPRGKGFFDSNHWIYPTGVRVPGARPTIEARQHEVEQVLERFFSTAAKGASAGTASEATGASELTADDELLLDKARNAKNGGKFRRLYDEGDWSGYDSESEADLALASMLGFWAGPDPDRVARLIQASGLADGKWRRADYAERTIGTALKGKTAFYERPADGGESTVADSAAGKPRPLSMFPFTDVGNAERLVAYEGENLRYVPGLGWHSWTGQRWAADEDGAVERAAKRIARLTAEAAEKARREARQADTLESEGKLIDALKKHARTMEFQRSLSAMIKLAGSDLQVLVRQGQLDADPFLLNVANGTVDLRSGELLLPRREHLITKWSQVVYDPNARDKLWDQLLAWIDGGYDGTLREYLRLALGYSITGSVQEDLVFLIDGPGGTCKSTAVEPVRLSVGEYGSVTPFDMLVQRRGDQAHPTDLARLVGRRLVTAEEGPKNRALDMAKVKSLSGGTSITARFMRGDFFEYEPVLKLWLVSNYRPRVGAEDTGAWRRLRALPFTNVVPEGDRDERLRGYLKRDPGAQSAVLAWLVSGARDWYERGRLETPECVLTRTQEWRRDTDRVGAWLEDECQLDPEAWESSKALQESINGWWKTYVQESGWDPPSLMAGLGDELKARGCRPGKEGGTRGWQGIRLRGNGFPFSGKPAVVVDDRPTSVADDEDF